MIQMNLFSKQKQPHRHREQTSGCQWGKVGGVMDWEVRLSRCKVLHTEGMDNKVLLYITENHIQYPMTNHNEKDYEKKYTHIYNLNHRAVHGNYRML